MRRSDYSGVNWFKLLDDLKRLAITLCDIEKATEIPKSTLIGFKEGRAPKHNDGEILINYWSDMTENSREIVPRLDIYSHCSD